uniref:Uncharacterized protein n=1 Tax=viral metagenome TaxID=1070528 RepID=A0A6C0LMD8_9ZZZZ
MEKIDYCGTSHLLRNVDTLLEKTEFKCVNVFAYKINNSHYKPFLSFLLHNNSKNNKLSIPRVYFFANVFRETEILKSYIIKQLTGMMNSQNYGDLSTDNVEVAGFYLNAENELCVFVDLSWCPWNTYDVLFKTEKLWFGIVDEIINKRQICNIDIDQTLIDFFVAEPEFVLLKDGINQFIETPMSCYVGKSEKQLNFIHMFGVSRSDKSRAFGPYFYFTDYQRAAEVATKNLTNKEDIEFNKMINDERFKKESKGGVVRFAVFMKKTKYVDNNIDNEPDPSETKKVRVNDPNLDVNYERLTNRISDHDGNWANKYDSLSIGNIVLDDGNEFKDNHYIVLKDYDQQFPLSYHLIDKKFVDRSFERNAIYHIM